MVEFMAFLRSPHIGGGYGLEQAVIWLLLCAFGVYIACYSLSSDSRVMATGAALVALGSEMHRMYWVLAVWLAPEGARTAAWATQYQWLHLFTVQVTALGAILFGCKVLQRTFPGRWWWGAPALALLAVLVAGMQISLLA